MLLVSSCGTDSDDPPVEDSAPRVEAEPNAEGEESQEPDLDEGSDEATEPGQAASTQPGEEVAGGEDESQSESSDHDDEPAPLAEDSVEYTEGFEEIAEELEELPGRVEAIFVEDDETLLQMGDGTAAPLASTSKLYVLEALAEAIESGTAQWGDDLEVTDELRSLPSGTLQDQEDGYSTTLFDVAHRMISISDNTGTDMVMDLLGREAIEEAVNASGNQQPELLQPFLTTQEVFQLRWGHPELGEDWEQLEESERRNVLEELSEHELDITSDDTSRDDVDFSIDWFASASDISTLHRSLMERAEDQPELHQVLTANPGLSAAIDDPWWQSVSFKGGGLPGVATGSWYATAEDGTQRSVVILLSTEETEDIEEARRQLYIIATEALTAGTDSEIHSIETQDEELGDPTDEG